MEILLLLAVAGGLWWLLQLRRAKDVVRTDTWSGEKRGATVDAVPRGSIRAVTAALARVEARQFASSVSFVLAVVISLLVLVVISTSDGYENDAIFGRLFQHFGALVYPIAGLALVAVNRATLRARREGTIELLTSTPTTSSTRTVAHMVSVWPALLAAVVTLSAATIWVLARGHAVGGWGPNWLAEVLLAVTLVAGGGALGVALGRWIPHGIVPAIALLGSLGVTGNLNGLDPFTNRARNWSLWSSPPPDLDPMFVLRPAWPHLVYVIGLVGIVAALAVMRTQRGGVPIGALVVGLALAGTGAVLQTSPVTAADAARIANSIDTDLECRTHAEIRTCTYPGYGAWRADWTKGARQVLALVPPASRPTPYVARQVVGNRGISNLDPEVRDRLRDRIPAGSYGFGGPDTEVTWYLLPAQAATGLPTSVRGTRPPCYAGNQSRAVLALWLTLATAPQALDSVIQDPNEEFSGVGASWHAAGAPWATVIWPSSARTDADAPVVYARADIDAARQMAARPVADIRSALGEDWSRWKGAATPTAELVDALGLAPVDSATARKVPDGLAPCR